MAFFAKETKLLEAADNLVKPHSSTDATLNLLDDVQSLLGTVEQDAPLSVETALFSTTTALVSADLLRNPDSDVRVSVASCLAEIMRINAPLTPYPDVQMKEVFQVTVEAFDKLADASSRSYRKAEAVLEIFAKVRSSLVMLDLECDDLVLDMFRRFLKVIRLDHPRLVLLSMKTIMITVINESDEIPMDLLETLLNSVKKESRDVSPAASTLVEKVLSSCARKLQPCIIEALKSTGTSLDIYSPVVSSICQSESAITQGHSDVNYSPLVPGLEEEAEVVGGGTSKITCVYRRVKKKNAPWDSDDEEPVILETGNPGRVDNRKPLVELLDFRGSSEQWDPVLRHLYEDEAEKEDVDYLRQRDDSQGFDFDPYVRIPLIHGITPFYFIEEEQPPTEMVLYGRLGVHWFNFENNRNLEFIRIPKLNTEHPFSTTYYITVDVKDVDAAAADHSLTLQTMVRRPLIPEFKLFMERCRIKPTTVERDTALNYFHCFVLDKFYRGPMPAFSSEPPASGDDAMRFYEVPKSDIDKIDWLLLYAEFSLFFHVCRNAGSHYFLAKDIEMKKVLVETKETHADTSQKLKSMNAIFHISFRANCCDYVTVVRRTIDGVEGHMFLEVDCRKKT